MRVAVIGATGAHGRRIASELARSDAVTSLLLVARTVDDLERLVSVLGGPRRGVSGLPIDVTAPGLEEALSGSDIVVSCVSAAHEACAATAVSTGAHCVVLADDPATLTGLEVLRDAALEKKVTVVAGCGFSPGITNLMASFASAQLDRVEAITVTVARSLGDAGGRASVHTLLDLFRSAADLEDGAAPDDPGHLPRFVYLPDPIGWIETFRAAHPEVSTLQSTMAGIRMVEYRIGLTERRASDLARAIAALGLTRNPLAHGLWSRLASGGALARAVRAGAATWTGARIDVHGNDGRPATISLGVVDRLGNLVPLMAARAAIELGTGAVGEPGVHPPEALFDPRATLTELSKRGVRIARLEPSEV
jgi:saccharopine dehydrogenase-like NADP-dependent oxidoreductase